MIFYLFYNIKNTAMKKIFLSITIFAFMVAGCSNNQTKVHDHNDGTHQHNDEGVHEHSDTSSHHGQEEFNADEDTLESHDHNHNGSHKH